MFVLTLRCERELCYHVYPWIDFSIIEYSCRQTSGRDHQRSFFWAIPLSTLCSLNCELLLNYSLRLHEQGGELPTQFVTIRQETAAKPFQQSSKIKKSWCQTPRKWLESLFFEISRGTSCILRNLVLNVQKCEQSPHLFRKDSYPTLPYTILVRSYNLQRMWKLLLEDYGNKFCLRTEHLNIQPPVPGRKHWREDKWITADSRSVPLSKPLLWDSSRPRLYLCLWVSLLLHKTFWKM